MNQPNTVPTAEQEAWLRQNHLVYHNDQLAVKFGVGINRLTYWLKILHLRKRKDGRKVCWQVKRKNKGLKRKIKPLPADHTNVSREQHVERILNFKII